MTKKLLISILFYFSLLYLIPVNSAQAVSHIKHCFGAEGSISIHNLPANKQVTISCPHDIGPSEVCQGDNSKAESTDFTYSFTKCSCFDHSGDGQGDPGCLTLDAPTGCTVNPSKSSSEACGVNDTKDISVDYVVDCPGPVATSTPATQAPTSTSAPGQPTATPTPGSACNKPCTSSTECVVPGTTNDCSACLPDATGGNKTCKPPATPVTPVVPPVGACNKPCTSSTECVVPGTTNDCNACLPDTTGTKTCKPPPGTTPGTTPGVTPPTACVENVTKCGIPGTDSCNGSIGGNPANCSTCHGGTCFGGICSSCNETPVGPTKTPTPVPPTPTPTPAFNCTCGDISTTSIIPGGQATITGHGLVKGANKAGGQIDSLGFRIAGGTNTSGAVLQSSGPIPAKPNGSKGDSDVYEALWNVTIPKTITDGKVYQIYIPSESIVCGPKKTAFALPERVVLGAADQTPQPNIFQKIGTFITSLFNNPANQSLPQRFDMAFNGQPTTVTPDPKKSQIIDTFGVAKVWTEKDANSCKFIKFQYQYATPLNH